MLAIVSEQYLYRDDDQSIYGFRGPDRRLHARNFEKDFPEVKKVFLSVNYRSQAAIVVRGAGCVDQEQQAAFS